MAKIKVGVVGATGYTGQELVRLLAQHPHASIEALMSQSYVDKVYSDVFPSFRGFVDKKCCGEKDLDAVVSQCDVLFMALPHALAADKVSDELLDRVKVIDLGADFRLKDAKHYESWYEFKHPRPAALKTAVYGLPEWRRDEIIKANLIANPGCYATCSILSLTPLVAAGVLQDETLIIDAKSGVSGAGRSLALGTHFNEVNESIKAYKVASHRHTPEIEQEISALASRQAKIVFTPHLIPMNRGILVTAYAHVKAGTSKRDLYEIYKSRYAGEPFIRLSLDEFPETRWVSGSNYCDIGLTLDERTGRAIVVGALDNLVKGAAGQAVQNMNLRFGFDEKAGLEAIAAFP